MCVRGVYVLARLMRVHVSTTSHTRACRVPFCIDHVYDACDVHPQLHTRPSCLVQRKHRLYACVREPLGVYRLQTDVYTGRTRRARRQVFCDVAMRGWLQSAHTLPAMR